MKGKDLIKWIQENKAEEVTFFKEFGNTVYDLCDGYSPKLTNFENGTKNLAWSRMEDGTIETVKRENIDTH